jgi:hypothetical protein
MLERGLSCSLPLPGPSAPRLLDTLLRSSISLKFNTSIFGASVSIKLLKRSFYSGKIAGRWPQHLKMTLLLPCYRSDLRHFLLVLTSRSFEETPSLDNLNLTCWFVFVDCEVFPEGASSGLASFLSVLLPRKAFGRLMAGMR